MKNETVRIKFPVYGWLGLAFIAMFWYLNWFLNGLRTQWGFFPMWLGYCLAVDGLVYKRKGTSLIKRSIKDFILLFIISAPAWWLFEFLNGFTKNWYYDGRQYFTGLQYFLLASLSFSTVMPAVFGTAELAGTFKLILNLKKRKAAGQNKSAALKMLAAGMAMLSLVIIFPEYFYYLIWIALYLIIEPVNLSLKNKTLIEFTRQGDWRPLAALSTGTLICGFFWEMWNYYSYPKWIYHLPFLNSLHVFQMPLPGFIGYIPFSFELYAIYHLAAGLISKKTLSDYIRII